MKLNFVCYNLDIKTYPILNNKLDKIITKVQYSTIIYYVSNYHSYPLALMGFLCIPFAAWNPHIQTSYAL